MNDGVSVFLAGVSFRHHHFRTEVALSWSVVFVSAPPYSTQDPVEPELQPNELLPSCIIQQSPSAGMTLVVKSQSSSFLSLNQGPVTELEILCIDYILRA